MDFAVSLNEASTIPLYVQLADALREAIVSGRLKAGTAMPSLRALSQSANVSRPTVSACYDLLNGQGLIETRRGSGTFVAWREGKAQEREIEGVERTPEDGSPVPPEEDRRIAQQGVLELAESLVRERLLSTPRADLVPVGQWQKVITRVRSRRLSLADRATMPLGHPELRAAIAQYLHSSRGVSTSRSEVLVFSCMNQAVDMILRALATECESVAIEDPAPVWLTELADLHGFRTYRIPVDNDGMQVQELESIGQSVGLVIVSPSHQQFTGSSLSMQRRQQLLSWAKQNQALIVEEDSDSQYRYGGGVVPPIASLGETENVIYIGSFSRVLGPLSRIAYACLPSGVLESVSIFRLLSSGDELSTREQCILSEFVSSGCIDLAIRRTQRSYAALQQAMIMAITKELRAQFQLGKQSGSMHLVGRFVVPLRERDIERLAEAAGITLISMRHFYSDHCERNEFAIPFANIDTREIREQMKRFAESIDQVSSGRSIDFSPATHDFAVTVPEAPLSLPSL